MLTSPSINAATARYPMPIYIALITAGLAGNYFKFPLFLDIDFLFGSIFAMLALQAFGLGRGILAAAMIASYTYIIWNHPYAIIIMTAEVAVVGWLMKRRQIGMVLADMLYWLVIGMPLVYLFYHLVMHISPSNTYMVMTKQAVNGIANALIARLIFTGYNLGSRSSLMSSRDILRNLLAFFVLCPVLTMLALGSRTDLDENDRNIRTSLTQDSGRVTQFLATWARNRKLSIINLADLAASKSPQEMQPYIEQAKKSDVNYLRVGLADKKAISVAFSPLVDEMGKSTIGVSFAERPYVPILQQTLNPILSEIIMGKVGIKEPRALMLAPVVIGGQYAGYVFGVLDFSQIREHLDKSSENNAMLYSLLDKNGNVILTNRTDQTIMAPFVREKGKLNRLDEQLGQWVPVLVTSTSIMERWRNSYYVAETAIGELAEWKLILEQPVAPLQKILYDNYTAKLTLLFLILLGALTLSELLSRQYLATLEKLSLLTHDLPIKLAKDYKEIFWPESAVKETHQLIDNFKDMADSLTAQFREIRQNNKTLELRVEERAAQLRESEKRFSTMFRLHSAVMLLIEPETGAIVDANLAAEEFYEFPREMLLSMNIGDLNTLSPDAIKIERLAACAEQRNYFIFQHKKASGAISIVEVHSTPITVHNTTLLFSIIHDITERKQMSDALQITQDRLEFAMKATPDAIWDWDLAAGIIYYSPRWWTMAGYESNELAADTSLWQRLIHPDDLEQASHTFNEAIAGEVNHYEIETRRQHKRGHYVPILTRGFIQRDNNGEAVRISGLDADLTERKKTEETQQQLALQLQQLEKTESLHRMAGAIAHTFNNMLGAAIGYLEIAMDDLPPEGSTSKFLASAFQATERAAEVSSMMLTYLGISFIEHISLDFSEVCRSSLTTLRGVIKKDVVLASDFPSTGPVVIADTNQMQRLLKNLVINASEAIQDEQGTITLIIRTVSSTDIPTAHRFPIDWQPQEDRFACLMVKDTGEGIAAKDIDKLFDPFFTSKFAGRGLGLAIVLGILRMHRGMVSVESEPGRGSVFQVFIPLSMDPVSLQSDNATQALAIEANHVVLLVEDEQPMREMVETMLKRLGFDVLAAKNGIEAIEIFRAHQDDIHIVLCDITMPGMDGWETLASLRTMVPTIPVIFISGHEEVQVMNTDQSEYPQVFLQKPFKRVDLQRALETVLYS